MSSSRYCFTLNNYTEEEYELLKGTVTDHCKYAILGREVGESGTPHIQGFCIFKQRCSFVTAKNRLNPRVHVEVAKGTPRQNRDYCRKAGDYHEHGEAPGGGASSGHSSRDDLAREFVAAVSGGKRGVGEFAAQRPGTYYFSGHNLWRNYLSSVATEERPDIHVRWFYGKPGTGKSREAHRLMPDAYIKDPRTKWWNGYRLEKEVIIDDFGPGGIDINHLLRWFDRYKCLVEVKGDMCPLLADKFIVTSNFLPGQCFCQRVITPDNVEDHPQLPALLRRINIINFS